MIQKGWQLYCIVTTLTLLFGCAGQKQAPKSTVTANTNRYRIMMKDSLFVNKGSVHDGHLGFLQSKSKIVGNYFMDPDGNRFAIGLIDFDGDQLFNTIDEDRYFLTIYGNPKIKINNGYGIPLEKMSMFNYFQVDNTLYKLQYVDPSGKYIDIEKEPKPLETGPPGMQLKTTVRDTLYKDYFDKKQTLKQMIGNKPYAYIYFWVSRPFEDGLNMIHYIQENHRDSVAIIGMHPAFADLDIDAYKNEFFSVLGKPWPQVICPKNLYMEMDQDLAWYSGILIDQNLKIVKVYTSPVELFNWLTEPQNR